jgi:hypothetical protein
METLYHTDKASGTAAGESAKKRVLPRSVFWLIIVNAALYALFIVNDIFVFVFSYDALPFKFFLALDGVFSISSILKYTSICICFAISQIVLLRTSRERDARLQVLIFGFTLIADYFLLFTDYFVVGIILFCGAHATAILRYSNLPIMKLVVGLALIFPAVPLLAAITELRPGSGYFGGATSLGAYLYEATLSAVSLYYIVLIVAATIAALIRRQPRVNNILSRLGMILFILCDINVLLLNLPDSGGSTELSYPAHIVAWVFYLPAQTMLAISAYDFKKPMRTGDSGENQYSVSDN